MSEGCARRFETQPHPSHIDAISSLVRPRLCFVPRHLSQGRS
jgi:hypothetical protein